MRRIRFQGQEWLLVGDRDGAITTEAWYQAGECSYAHLFPDGAILRFGEEIGRIDEVEFGDPVEIYASAGAMAFVKCYQRSLNILTHPSWDGP